MFDNRFTLKFTFETGAQVKFEASKGFECVNTSLDMEDKFECVNTSLDMVRSD